MIVLGCFVLTPINIQIFLYIQLIFRKKRIQQSYTLNYCTKGVVVGKLF